MSVWYGRGSVTVRVSLKTSKQDSRELKQNDVLGGYDSKVSNEKSMGDTLPFGKWPFGKTYSYIGLGDYSMCALTSTGEVYCVGDCESTLRSRAWQG